MKPKVTPDAIPSSYEDSDPNSNPFISLSELLGYKRETEGTLATAIEEKGIYTWDRFGRFGLADEAGRMKALDLLADQHAWKVEGCGPSGYRDTQSPLDQCEGRDGMFEHYGWATKVCPDFNVIRLGQSEREPRQSKGGETNSRNTLLVIIAALAKKLKIDIGERGAAAEIHTLTELAGIPVSDDTIRGVLKMIPIAVEKRTKQT